MKRREFISRSCVACLSVAGVSSLLLSCKSVKFITGKLNSDGLIIDPDDFKINKGGSNSFRSYVIVRNEALKYPICVHRFGDKDYSALWMQCTHQGTELQAAGDYLHCPAHGSEFSNKGQVINGPADRNLKSFPVTITNNELFIDLRKQ
jgi:Rieske Fe-S protein